MSFKRNTAVTGFPVGLVNASDGSAITTGTPVVYYKLDGGSQATIADTTPTHEGNGEWSFNLTSAEMNGEIVGLTVTHPSAIPVHFTIKTDTKIISELQDITAAQVNAEADSALADYDGPVLSAFSVCAWVNDSESFAQDSGLFALLCAVHVSRTDWGSEFELCTCFHASGLDNFEFVVRCVYLCMLRVSTCSLAIFHSCF